MSARGLLAGTFLAGALLATAIAAPAASAAPVPSTPGAKAPAVVPGRAPVPVTSLTCDGDTYKCTAHLQYGDGGWVAVWSVNVVHQ